MDTEKMNPDPSRQMAAGPGATNPKDLLNRGAEIYDQTKQTVSEAYDKTTRTLSEGYDQAMTYGRENPGKIMLIAFGVGFGVGLLLAGRRSRTGRYAEPVI